MVAHRLPINVLMLNASSCFPSGTHGLLEGSETSQAKLIKTMHGKKMFDKYMEFLSDEKLFVKTTHCFKHQVQSESHLQNSRTTKKRKDHLVPGVTCMIIHSQNLCHMYK